MARPGEDGISETQLTISEVVTDLAVSETVRTDWSKTLCAAPSAISVLGECAILSSVANASCVQLDFGDKGSATLPAKLFECNQIGRVSFVEAQARMQSISIVSGNVGPLIDNIMILLDEKQTPHVSKALDIYLQGLEKSAQKTTQDTEAILQRFKDWYKFTIELSNKIVGKQDTLVLEEKAKRENVRKKEVESDSAEANARRAQRKLELQQEKLNEAIQRRQMMMDVATTAVEWGGAASMANPYAGLGIIVAAEAPVAFAEVAVSKARQVKEEEMRRVEEAEKEREKLVSDLRELQHEESSLGDIQKVLGRALERLIALQLSVETILLFFEAIQSDVHNLVQMHNTPLLELLEFGKNVSPEEKSELVNMMVRHQALDVKVRFTIMQRLAQVYCEVSEQHILSGFDVVHRLSKLQSSMSDDDVRARDQMLEEYRKRATAGIEDITQMRKKALIDTLQSIVERGARGTIQKKIGPA